VFGDFGYPAAAWGTIIERTGMTKGALYHHFDSKESLASAIIEEGSDAILSAFRNVCGSSSPALENMIHGTFTIANLLSSDKMARAAEQLIAASSGFNKAAGRFYARLVDLMAAQARRATVEGDLRPDIDPGVISESIVACSACGCCPTPSQTTVSKAAATGTGTASSRSGRANCGHWCSPVSPRRRRYRISASSLLARLSAMPRPPRVNPANRRFSRFGLADSTR
jgi:AcrR family transcriptional regulator